MECGKLTAKLRDAVPVCFIEDGKEVKRFKNIEIPDEIKKLPYQSFEFSIPVTGAITFKIMFEEGVLPKVWPEARTRKTRKARSEEVPIPEKITSGLQSALEQAQAVGQPVAEIAEAVAQGAEITTELNGQVLTITAHEPENIANSYNPQEYAFVCPEGKLLTYHRLNCNQSTGKHLLCYQASCTFPGRRFRPAFPPLRAHRGGGFGESGRHGDTILNISSVLCKFPPLNDYFHVFMDFLLTIC